jgi:hypothetical protein
MYVCTIMRETYSVISVLVNEDLPTCTYIFVYYLQYNLYPRRYTILNRSMQLCMLLLEPPCKKCMYHIKYVTEYVTSL